MIETETMNVLAFTVYGLPQPAGSKRGFAFQRKNGSTGVAISDANPKSREWKNLVSDAVRAVHQGELLRGPLALTLIFHLPRPKGHYGSGRNATTVKRSAPEYPAGKPDVLKLGRCVEDALTGVLYADDAQIVNEILAKRFGEPARVELVVSKIELATTRSDP